MLTTFVFGGVHWWTSWPSVAAAVTAVALAVAYRYATSTYGYWRDRGVPCAGSPVPLFGNLFGLITGAEQQIWMYRRLYRTFDGRAYCGLYQMRTPYLMVRDPELINRLLIRDFGHFTDHGVYTSEPRDNPLSNDLFNMKGAQWKGMRAKLSPAFTAGKLRNMRPEMAECGERLLRDMADALRTGDGTMEVRDKLGDYSTDVIGACAFGLRLNAIDDRQSEFRRYGREVFRPTALFLVRELSWLVSPALRRMIRISDFPPDTIRFFTDAFGDTVDRRTRSGVVREDLVQTLIRARTDLVVNKTVPDVKFEETDIVANAFVMFAAGFETVSTAMSFCLYELALKKHIQDRVRNEIIATKVKHGDEIKSEFLTDLQYMEMVLAETLRKYPPLLTLFREATQDYYVPDDTLVIEKGTKIIIPVNAIHYDYRYYPDPETFDPERFNAEEKAKRPSCTYLPFGDGPRICIGKRFAEMEMKLALTEILTKYEVEPCAKTDIPMKFSAQSLLLVPENGIWLRFISVQKPSSVQ